MRIPVFKPPSDTVSNSHGSEEYGRTLSLDYTPHNRMALVAARYILVVIA